MAMDPAFAKFFAEEFPILLDTTEIPGSPGASWDRRAAYLLWTAGRGGYAQALTDEFTAAQFAAEDDFSHLI